MRKRLPVRALIGSKAKIHENNFVAKKTDSESVRRVFSNERHPRCAVRVASMFFKRYKKHAPANGFLNLK